MGRKRGMAGLAMVTVLGQDHNTIFNNIVLGLLFPVNMTTINLETVINLRSRGFLSINLINMAKPRTLSQVIIV